MNIPEKTIASVCVTKIGNLESFGIIESDQQGKNILCRQNWILLKRALNYFGLLSLDFILKIEFII